MPPKNFSYPHIPPRTSSLPSSPSSPPSTQNFHSNTSSTNPSSAPSITNKKTRTTNPHFSTYIPGPNSPIPIVYAHIHELSGEPAQAEHRILHRSASGRLTRQVVGDLRPRDGTSASTPHAYPISHLNGYNADSEYSSASNSNYNSGSASDSNSNSKFHRTSPIPGVKSVFSDCSSSPTEASPAQLRQARAVSVKDFRRASVVTVSRARRSRKGGDGVQEGEDTDGDVWSELAEEEERLSRDSKESVESKGKGRVSG